MSNGIWGNMFDLNNDGNLDCFEQALEFMFLDELVNKDDEYDLNFDFDD